MLIPGQPHFASDTESLQTDVMRFMAIIAFCLIAILALVRNTEPAAPIALAESSTPAEPPTPTAPTHVAPMTPVEPTAPAQSTPPVTLTATAPPPPVEPAPQAKLVAPAAPSETVPVSPPAPPTSIARTVTTRPPTDAEAPDVTIQDVRELPLEQEQPPEEGLTLRFASDSDFLRLIARGDISVYAFDGPDVLKLDGEYRFLDASSPGQVYELLPGSIPSLLVDALKQQRLDISDYHWGIALPSRIRTRIERYLNNRTNGQLVIDRYGDVHHVAA